MLKYKNSLWTKKRKIKISKFLSYVLRHKPQSIGLALEKNKNLKEKCLRRSFVKFYTQGTRNHIQWNLCAFKIIFIQTGF